MDEEDSWFFSKKHDKADATSSSASSNKKSSSSTGSEKITIVSRPASSDTYDNNHPCVGIALIFNHKDVKGQKTRDGTERDRDELHMALDAYGFDVRVYNDLTFEKVIEKLKKTANEDHSRNDCLVVAVMSHGTEGQIFAKDMCYPTERLWKPFLGENCKTLINKPKLFFIQACRGEQLEKSVTYDKFTVMTRNAQLTKTTYAIPNTADILIYYSTFENHFSFRNVEKGSWFIQSLCEELHNAAQTTASSAEGAELLRLLTAVNRKVAYAYQSNAKVEVLNQLKEMPNFLSTLTKTFYLRVKRRDS